MGFWFLPTLVLPLVYSFLPYSHTSALNLYLNVSLAKPHSNKNFHKSSPKNSHPTIASFVPYTSAKGLSDAVKKLVKQALHPFHSRPYAVLYIHPLSSSVPSFWCSVAPCYFFLLILVQQFQQWDQSLSPWIHFMPTFSQWSTLSLPSPFFPRSRLPRKTLVLLYKQIVCSISLIVIFQASSEIQDGNCLIHCSLLT